MLRDERDLAAIDLGGELDAADEGVEARDRLADLVGARHDLGGLDARRELGEPRALAADRRERARDLVAEDAHEALAGLRLGTLLRQMACTIARPRRRCSIRKATSHCAAVAIRRLATKLSAMPPLGGRMKEPSSEEAVVASASPKAERGPV